jgi:hypothetical protein
VPPQAAPYFLSAFLDDNGTTVANGAAARPDRGDLVSIIAGFKVPTIVVATATSVELNLPLSYAMPQ